MRGCDDPKCCPVPRKRTKEEKWFDEKLGFINDLARMAFLDGKTLYSVELPKSYFEGRKFGSGKGEFVFTTDYGDVLVFAVYSGFHGKHGNKPKGIRQHLDLATG